MSRIPTRRLVVVGVVLLVLFGLLLLSIRDVVREVVVIPLSYLVWVIGIFLRSTPQLFFWLVVLLLGLWMASRTIRPKKKSVEEETPRLIGDEATGSGQGRVAYWAIRVNMLHMGSYYQGSFNEALSRLLVETLAYRHRLTNRQVEQGLEKGTLPVPPEVRAFVRTNLRRAEMRQWNMFSWFFRNLRVWFMNKIRRISDSQSFAPDPVILRVINFMEEELEVTYDQSGR